MIVLKRFRHWPSADMGLPIGFGTWEEAENAGEDWLERMPSPTYHNGRPIIPTFYSYLIQDEA